jgi:hypothetical protein
MGVYTVRIARTRGRSSKADAIDQARHEAAMDGVQVFGEPTLRRRNSPVPVLGPHRTWVVTFNDATKTFGGKRPSQAA